MDETTPVQSAESNKKWLYIVIGVVVVLLLGGMFFGVGGRGTGPGSAYFAPEGVDVDRNMDGSTTYSSEEGSVTVGQGASMPTNWPSDAPTAYTGAQIMYSGSTNPQTGEAGSAVVYQTSASAASVVEYYTARLKAEGWTIEASAEMAGTRVISAKKDSRTIGVYIQDAGNGTTNVTAGVQL